MHDVYERYLNTKNEGMVSPTVSGHDSSPCGLVQPVVQGAFATSAQGAPTTQQHFVNIDELPNSYSQSRRKLGTYSNDHSPPSGSFEIFFLYLTEEIMMTVWNTMPMSNLFTFAWQWMRQEFEFDGMVDDIDLVRRSGHDAITYLQHSGCVRDVPLYANDEITIETVELVPHMLHRPSPHSSSRHSQPRRTVHPVAARYVPESLESADDRIDPKSYDKFVKHLSVPNSWGMPRTGSLGIRG